MTFNMFAKDGKPSELIIREGKAPDQLPILEPQRIMINGTIGAPYEFLLRRLKVPDQIDIGRSFILVNREQISIELATNFDEPYNTNTISGQLDPHPKFKEFGINNGKAWEPNELGQFFKMHRFFFADKSENMKIVTDLLNFEAKVNVAIEKQKSEKGDFKDNYSGAVQSNLPGTFKLKIPIFKGQEPEEIEVEFYSSVNGRDVKLQLVSPGANQMLEDIRDEVIDEQIELIREIAPEIVIIEV